MYRAEIIDNNVRKTINIYKKSDLEKPLKIPKEVEKSTYIKETNTEDIVIKLMC
mgnify:CR=1 FL=1